MVDYVGRDESWGLSSSRIWTHEETAANWKDCLTAGSNNSDIQMEIMLRLIIYDSKAGVVQVAGRGYWVETLSEALKEVSSLIPVTVNKCCHVFEQDSVDLLV